MRTGPRPALRHGDRFGEHVRMQRGRFRAWQWVYLAFLIEVFLLGIPFGWAGHLVAGALKFDQILDDACVRGAGAVGGIAAAIWVFWDRWRVFEAFASRYTYGIANLSIGVAPWATVAYANYRAVQKFFGR